MNETSNETARIPNRTQRRLAMKHQGLLEQKRNLSLSDWSKLCREIRSKGQEIHQANVERNDKAIFAKLEEIESKKISTWKEDGYTDKEIEKLREAYSLIMIKDKSTWQADKKVARNIIKEARLNLQKNHK
jgi:hypothetical protein|tara:strand:+ start:1875 stop:2267 length:393 start_codon:yes stop_codon:yes gene_type:complete